VVLAVICESTHTSKLYFTGRSYGLGWLV